MNIVCTICRDCFIQSDDISVTRCGHIFHLTCLSRWLTRSSSCPECREKTSQERTKKLYVTFANNEANNTDTLSTQERIDSLKFQVLLNEKNIKYYTSKNETLEKQNAGLRQEVRKVESEINKKNSTIYFLKEQMKYLGEKHGKKSMECETLKLELLSKEKEIEKLQYMKKLLYGSALDAEEVIEKTDHNTLVTHVKVTNRIISRNIKRWEWLHEHIKQCVTTLTKFATLVEEQSEKPEIIYDKCLTDNVTGLLDQSRDIEKLILSSLKKCQRSVIKCSLSNNSRKLSESSDDTQEIEIVPSKTSGQLKVESGNGCGSGSGSTNSLCLKTKTNTNQIKCSIPKKRAKSS